MKATLIVLALVAALSLFSAVTGIQRISSSNGARPTITYHTEGRRALVGIFGVACGIAALGCAKRQLFGWWMVATILSVILLFSTIWAVWTTVTFDLPIVGKLLGGLGELLKIALWSWLLFGFWRRQKKGFEKNANEQR